MTKSRAEALSSINSETKRRFRNFHFHAIKDRLATETNSNKNTLALLRLDDDAVDENANDEYLTPSFRLDLENFNYYESNIEKKETAITIRKL